MIHFARRLAADEAGYIGIINGLHAAVLATILVTAAPAAGTVLKYACGIIAHALQEQSLPMASAPG